eukprot:CAMPEP_0184692302 /NCGR_PEP_ID=MMETSP0313-20130426/842_1 /TAXON_ID=2792 /ORGANISM="Porphyridium aerugineum, Strain SAG 1380-2" /LENGTH=112 /DNA_ID=CAMNT_0027150127 /DNA_START=70 /DNA_END=408 /DNA_ORIENTATION=-
MPEITPNVTFVHIAREWRMKWSMDDNKSSLVQIQSLADSHLARIKQINGFVNVQRIVCGSCLDYKLIITLRADHFDDWKHSLFEPEQEFLEKCREIVGVHTVETQTYTIETL